MNERVLLHCEFRAAMLLLLEAIEGAYRGLSTLSSSGMLSSTRAAAAQLIYSVLCDGRLSSHGVCY